MLNIVVPMAGNGTRFAEAGYLMPKPLIDIRGTAMIELVIGNIRPRRAHRFIFICQRAHDDAYGIGAKLALWAPGCEVVLLDGVTDGAACTVLATRQLIDTGAPLMIANSDQYIDVAIDDYLGAFERSGHDGLIMTMQARDPKWSYAALDGAGMVIRVAEKNPISTHATVGIYNFAHGADFVDAADRMVAAHDRTGGEFYLAPVYNYLIEAGLKVGVHDIGLAMHGLGVPNDLDRFMASGFAPRLAEHAM